MFCLCWDTASFWAVNRSYSIIILYFIHRSLSDFSLSFMTLDNCSGSWKTINRQRFCMYVFLIYIYIIYFMRYAIVGAGRQGLTSRRAIHLYKTGSILRRCHTFVVNTSLSTSRPYRVSWILLERCDHLQFQQTSCIDTYKNTLGALLYPRLHLLKRW